MITATDLIEKLSMDEARDLQRMIPNAHDSGRFISAYLLSKSTEHRFYHESFGILESKANGDRLASANRKLWNDLHRQHGMRGLKEDT